MIEFRQSHRSTTPKWSSSSNQGALLCCPHHVPPQPMRRTAIWGLPANINHQQTQNLNHEETARQRRGNRTSTVVHHTRQGRLPPWLLRVYNSPIQQQTQGCAGCWAREPRGATESGSPAWEEQGTAARRGRRAGSGGVAVGEVRR